jgi:tripartite-type tricarboxylate transporter receptor subunit TctC
MVINSALPVKSVQELIAHARTRTDPLRFSSAGVGNGQHLAAELFALRAGIRMLHVPYKGGGPALSAVVSGETHVQFPSAAPAAPFIHAGKIRALGFTGATRVASLPDVPTIAEAGLAGFEFDAGWHGWLAPAGTPKAVIDRLATELRKAVSTPKLRDYLAGAGYDPRAEGPAAFRKIIERDIERYAEILRAAKVEPQ